MPKNYAWQDVKDEIKIYAPHLSVNNYEGDEAAGIWAVDIRSNKEADLAYSTVYLLLTERMSANIALQLH